MYRIEDLFLIPAIPIILYFSIGNIRNSYLFSICKQQQLGTAISININNKIVTYSIKMPELPEVQTVRRFLSSALLKPHPKKIKNIKLYYPNIVKQIQPKQFVNKLVGQSFRQIDRYGKYLILKLSQNSIISHLRMEGKYSYHQNRPQIGKHDHVEFILNDGSSLVYSDVRKFGTMHLVEKGQQLSHKSIAKLGPEINNNTQFTVQYMTELSRRKSGPVKKFLLDQEEICGAGNIYADQILFAAGVHPQRNINNLKDFEIEKIVKYGKIIIDDAIENKGTTFRSFSSNNQKGSNQNSLKVYGRQNQICEQCNKSKIKKIKLVGRGTQYCPTCQSK